VFIQNISKKPENHTDMLADVIDMMTMETTRVPIKINLSKTAYEAWKLPQCMWDSAKAPIRSPHADLPQDPQYILNENLQQKQMFCSW
jgi:hypothetical protein